MDQLQTMRGGVLSSNNMTVCCARVRTRACGLVRTCARSRARVVDVHESLHASESAREHVGRRCARARASLMPACAWARAARPQGARERAS